LRGGKPEIAADPIRNCSSGGYAVDQAAQALDVPASGGMQDEPAPETAGS
jgi:hypothetical protein